MDHQGITAQSELEHILFDESAKPKALRSSLLEYITKGFSDDMLIGYGGFARVYKGMLDNGTAVAVKKLLNTVDINDKNFSNEVHCLMKANHKNIVRFLGFCYETRWIDCVEEFVIPEVRQRLLCFEYLPRGSLDKYISEPSLGLDWRTRYKIISGICDGLYYLHQKNIIHLDLKPSNILLDDNMMPKIADFGLSRCFDDEQSRFITSKLIGTVGYLAPEFYGQRQITMKLDIYSLGIIIIEILTGEKGYPDIEDVLQMWSTRLEKSQRNTQLEQVRVCIEIAIQCTDFNAKTRPDTQHVIDRLGAIKSADESATETGASNSLSVTQVSSNNNPFRQLQHDSGSKVLALDLTLELQMDHRVTTAQIEQEHMLFDESAEPKPLSLSLLEHTTSGFSDDKQIGHVDFSKVYKEASTSKGLEIDPALKLQLDHRAISAQSKLERMLFDESTEPMPLPLSLLEHITSGFSDANQIGCGGFAMVYKGMLRNGTIAVKKLFIMADNDENQFAEELCCLMKAKHKNIVRFLGYCSDTQGEILKCDGKLVLADLRERLLCFEYLPNGCLEPKITDASSGLDWRKRYQIINGICDGLYYLHQMYIVHFDLKPENILLDENMVPKIADFGLSRCFNEKQRHAIASKLTGTMGYLAPEFIHGSRLITFEADIFSLGIIMIRIITGKKEYPCPNIDNVLESWKNRLDKSELDTQLVQVRVCTEIATKCIDNNPEKRPDIQHIIARLGATKSHPKLLKLGQVAVDQ